MRAAAIVVAVLATTATAPSFADEAQDPLWSAGRSIYYNAARIDGSPIRVTVQQDVPLPPGSGACVSCHRRSGLGVAEGGARALNVSGPALFQASSVPPIRPAYDDALLARVLISGIDANGQPLSDLMPRYELTAEDALAVSRYLRTLGTEPPPGLTDTEITIASIVVPDSPDGERAALQAVLPEYVKVKNGGTRHEQRRSEMSSRNYYGIKRYRAYREWKHSFWRLTGKPATWPAQLQKYYAESPPFAIVSGSLGVNAAIVDDFCEQMEIACVLPMTSLPPAAEDSFYSLYFSSGVRLEGRLIGRHLARVMSSTKGGVLLVYNKDAEGLAARQAVRDGFASDDPDLISDYAMKPGKIPSARDWARMLKKSGATALVPLLSAAQLQNLTSTKLDRLLVPDVIVTAQSFTNWSDVSGAEGIIDRVKHVYPYNLPTANASQFPREDVWLRSRGIDLPDRISAAKVLFACKALGMALADIQSNFSREYLLESLEHALDNSFLTSLYPRITLGPDQRFLSRGAFLARVTMVEGKPQITNGVWMQP